MTKQIKKIASMSGRAVMMGDPEFFGTTTLPDNEKVKGIIGEKMSELPAELKQKLKEKSIEFQEDRDNAILDLVLIDDDVNPVPDENGELADFEDEYDRLAHQFVFKNYIVDQTIALIDELSKDDLEDEPKVKAFARSALKQKESILAGLLNSRLKEIEEEYKNEPHHERQEILRDKQIKFAEKIWDELIHSHLDLRIWDGPSTELKIKIFDAIQDAKRELLFVGSPILD